MKISNWHGEVEIEGVVYKAAGLSRAIKEGVVKHHQHGKIYLYGQERCEFVIVDREGPGSPPAEKPLILISEQHFVEKLVLPSVGGCTYHITHCTFDNGLEMLE